MVMVMVMVMVMAMIVVVSCCRAGRSSSKRSGEESFMVVGYGAIIHGVHCAETICIEREL